MISEFRPARHSAKGKPVKNRLPELIRAVEQGEKVVVTRHGKPPLEPRQVRLSGMKDRIKLLPGWDASTET